MWIFYRSFISFTFLFALCAPLQSHARFLRSHQAFTNILGYPVELLHYASDKTLDYNKLKPEAKAQVDQEVAHIQEALLAPNSPLLRVMQEEKMARIYVQLDEESTSEESPGLCDPYIEPIRTCVLNGYIHFYKDAVCLSRPEDFQRIALDELSNHICLENLKGN